MKLLDKMDHDDVDKVVIVTAIITTICAFILPVVILPIVQGTVLFDRDNWFVNHTGAAYLVVTGAFLVVTAVSLLYFFTKRYWMNKHPIVPAVIVFFLMLLSFPAGWVGAMNYYYFTDEGFTVNKMISLDETFYAWEDVELLALTITDDETSASYDTIELTFENGDRFEFDASDPNFLNYRRNIMQTVEANGGEVDRGR